MQQLPCRSVAWRVRQHLPFRSPQLPPQRPARCARWHNRAQPDGTDFSEAVTSCVSRLAAGVLSASLLFQGLQSPALAEELTLRFKAGGAARPSALSAAAARAPPPPARSRARPSSTTQASANPEIRAAQQTLVEAWAYVSAPSAPPCPARTSHTLPGLAQQCRRGRARLIRAAACCPPPTHPPAGEHAVPGPTVQRGGLA
jgi:hypothetical protein